MFLTDRKLDLVQQPRVEEEEGDIGEMAVKPAQDTENYKEEPSDTHKIKDAKNKEVESKEIATIVNESYLTEKDKVEIEDTVLDLAGMSSGQWSLMFYAYYVQKKKKVKSDLFNLKYVEDEYSSLSESSKPKQKNSKKKVQTLSSNTIQDPDDPNFVIVGPYRRRIK